MLPVCCRIASRRRVRTTTSRRQLAAWRRRWPRSGPGGAWPRLDGWLPAGRRRSCGRGRRWRPGSPATPVRVDRGRRTRRASGFDLQLVAPRLPQLDVPPGTRPIRYLRELAMAGVARRYPDPEPAGRLGAAGEGAGADRRLKDFPGYFLIVHDIVDVRAEPAAFSARAAARPPTRWSATRSASPRST